MPSPGVKIGHDNREAVRAWFTSHIGGTQGECARAIGLSVFAVVGRHIATIRKEWEASGPEGDAYTCQPECRSCFGSDCPRSPRAAS